MNLDKAAKWLDRLVVVVMILLVTYSAARDSHERGVRDALAGKYTIVNMPDGTSRVCEVKKQEVSK